MFFWFISSKCRHKDVVSDCCIITSSKIRTTAGRDQGVKGGRTSSLKHSTITIKGKAEWEEKMAPLQMCLHVRAFISSWIWILSVKRTGNAVYKNASAHCACTSLLVRRRGPLLGPITCSKQQVPLLPGDRLGYYSQDWPECSGSHDCSSPGSQPKGGNIDTVNHPWDES